MEPTTTKSEYALALDLMTRYLSIRDHSRYELRTKLERRFEPALVAELMHKAEASGWLKSEAEIASLAVELLLRRGKSQRQIEEEMHKRHLPIPPRDDEKELESLRKSLLKKFGPPQALGAEDRLKAQRFLMYRGFEDRMIRMVIDGPTEE